MKKFITGNWFKIIIAVAVLIIAICAGYYFISNSSKYTQPAIVQTTNSQNSIADQQDCANQASKAYIAEGFGSADQSRAITSYVDHYNQKLNKCFIEITDNTGSSLLMITLLDAYELKEYASYMYFWGPKGNNGGPNPVCSLDEQIPDVSARAPDCTSQTGFDSYVSPYMSN
jgi:uncharacterized protein YxeA